MPENVISQVEANIPIVDDNGIMQDHFRAFTIQVTGYGMIVGTGTPEASVEALPGRLYMDDAGVAGSILYVKRDAHIGGDKTKGWVLV